MPSLPISLPTSTSPSGPSSREHRHIATFESWLITSGVSLDDVNVEFTPEKGYHLLVKRDVPPGTAVVQVKPSLLITSDAAAASTSFAPILLSLTFDESVFAGDDQPENFLDTLTILLFLMHERSKQGNSTWHPYLSLLPLHESFTSPLFYSEKELALLEGTDIHGLITENRSRIRTFYDAVIPQLRAIFGDLFASEENSTWEMFIWAYSCVDSRAFKFASNLETTFAEQNNGSNNDLVNSQYYQDELQEKLRITLCPLADFANHSSSVAKTNIRYIGSRPNSIDFKLVTTRHVFANEELCFTYNQFTNEELLLFYGFVDKNNPTKILIDLAGLEIEEDYEVSLKREILINFSGGHTHSIDEEGFEQDLLDSLAILLMPQSELDQVTVHNLPDLVNRISQSTRSLVFQTVASILRTLELAHPSSLDEDLAVLFAGQVSPRERVVRQFLVKIKQVLKTNKKKAILALASMEQ